MHHVHNPQLAHRTKHPTLLSAYVPLPTTRGAALYFTSYWLIGLPTGIALGFWACWGALGLWLGVATATALQAVAVHLWVALRLDWHKEVARSQSNLEALLDCHAAGVAADAAGAEDDGGRGTQGAAGAGAGDGDVTEPLLGRGA